MTDKVLPVELVQKCYALVEKTHQSLSSGLLAQKIATKRNSVAAAMLPEAFVILQTATSWFKIRVVLWAVAAVALALSWFWSVWLLLLTGLAVILERIATAKEREYWRLLAAMLLSAEMLIIDFAGWGTAHPRSREAAATALGSTSDDPGTLEWLDYYLPRRAELAADLVKAFGPGVT